MESAMKIFEISKPFPSEEKYSLTDQIRRSSRSVCTNIAEGWRKRRYPNAFVSKLSDADSEAAETQVWLEFALKRGYLDQNLFDELSKAYDHIMGKLVNMMVRPEQWRIKSRSE
jgi:four helix bundle protein